MLVDLGVLEEYPSDRIPGFNDALIALLPSLEEHACSLGRRGGFITPPARWHLGRPRRRAHRARVPDPGRGRTSATARRARRARSASTTASTSIARSRSGLEAGRMAVRLVNHLDCAGRSGGRLRLRVRDRAAHPDRRAPGLRAVHPGPDRRSGQPRHPVHPSRPPLAGPVRPRRPPAADPGDDDLADLGHRRRRGVGQEPDQPAPRFGRPAGPAGGGGRRPTTRRSAAAGRLGFPCVVKPLDGNHGRGVHLDLRTADAVRAAFPGALRESRAGRRDRRDLRCRARTTAAS